MSKVHLAQHDEIVSSSEDLISPNGLTSGPIHRQIFILAWPTMLAMILETFFNLIDAFWVGKLGPDALAAVSGASFILWAVLSISQISAVGITATVSQHIGAGNHERAVRSGFQGTCIGFVIGLIVGLGGILSIPFLFGIMDFSLNVHEQAEAYLSIYLGFLSIAFMYISLEAIFRAAGDTKTPMIILGAALLVNSVLDPLFIYGYFGFPELGVSGAALATILSYTFALGCAVVILWRRNLLPSITFGTFSSFDWIEMGSIVRIGLPIAITGASFSFVYILLTRIINHFGSASLAALGMGHRIEGIAYLTCVGFATAASTMVGQNIGAGKADRAERSAWIATFYASLMMGIFSLIACLFAPMIMTVFIKDTEVVILGSQYLVIIALCEVFLAFEIVLEGAFSGAGDTMPPMMVSIPLTFLRLPAAYFFAIHLNYGVIAIWMVISFSTLIKGIVISIWFGRGKWKTKKLTSDLI